jgi:hypothetical protein
MLNTAIKETREYLETGMINGGLRFSTLPTIALEEAKKQDNQEYIELHQQMKERSEDAFNNMMLKRMGW